MVNRDPLVERIERERQDSIRAEPKWSDIEAFKAWLEERYPLLEDTSLGSPLFRYMKVCYESKDTKTTPTTFLGSMLSVSEWHRVLTHCPDSARQRELSHPNNILYPEYNWRQWPEPNSVQQDPEFTKAFFSGWDRINPLPPPADKALFADSYPPHLRRQPLSNDASSMRKGDHRDETPSDHLATKKRRQPSDLSGGVAMSAKPTNPYKGHIGLRHPNDLAPMLPPLRPQHKVVSAKLHAGVTNLNLQRNEEDEEDGSLNSHDAVEVTRTALHSRFISNETKEFSGGPRLNLLLTAVQTPGPARQSDQNVETPKTGGSLHSDPTQKRSIEEVEDGQPASSAAKKRRMSPNVSSEYSLISSPLNERSLLESSNKSSSEYLDNTSLAGSPSRSGRIPSNSGDDSSLISSPPTETTLAAASRKRSIEDVEDAPPTTSTPKRKRTSLSPGSNPSSPFDPQEQSTPDSLQRTDKISTDNGTRDAVANQRHTSQEFQSYEDPTTVLFRPNDREGPALQLGSPSVAIEDARNPEATNAGDQPTAGLKSLDATLNDGSEMQEHGSDVPVPPESDFRGEHHLHVKEVPDGTSIFSEHPRDQTTTNVKQSGGSRTEQTAISVTIPLQIPHSHSAANQELPPDDDTMNVPVIRNKRKGGRMPSTRGRKALQSEPQREQGKRKHPTKGRKDRQSKPEHDQYAYVGRLRSGVGDRKHRKPRLVVLEFQGRRRSRSEPTEISNSVELRPSPNTTAPNRSLAIMRNDTNGTPRLDFRSNKNF